MPSAATRTARIAHLLPAEPRASGRRPPAARGLEALAETAGHIRSMQGVTVHAVVADITTPAGRAAAPDGRSYTGTFQP